MISVQNISKSYGTQLIFKNGSFAVKAGEKIALIGRNGYGKTTLLRIIAEEEECDAGEIIKPKGYRIGYLKQEFEFASKNILEEVCLGLTSEHGDEFWQVKKVLVGLGFAEKDFERAPCEFSGGYQMRISLAKLLVGKHDMFLLDEPTNFLDIVSIRWLVEFLKEWPGELVIISHDRHFLNEISTHVVGIHRHAIRKIQGIVDDYFEQIFIEEEVHEKQRTNQEKRDKQMKEFISAFRAKARHANLVQSRIKTLEKQQTFHKLHKISTLSFKFQYAPFEPKNMLDAENIGFHYPDSPFLFRNLSFSMQKGDRIGILGKNGMGKTTLLRILARNLEQSEGRFRYHKNTRLAYFAQSNTINLNPKFTIEEEIMSVMEGANTKSARDICGSMMFSGDMALKKISVLSGGEKCRVLLGKIIASPANVLLLDEPTHHLDMESCESLVEAMQEFEGAVIIVTHNEDILERVTNNCIVFRDRNAFFHHGNFAEISANINDEAIPGDSGVRNNEKRETVNSFKEQKNIKKERAIFIQERSKILTPLKAKVKEIENSIEEFENKINLVENDLITASMNQDSKSIIELSRELSLIKRTIDELYITLESATEVYEKEVLKQDNNFKEQFS